MKLNHFKRDIPSLERYEIAWYRFKI